VKSGHKNYGQGRENSTQGDRIRSETGSVTGNFAMTREWGSDIQVAMACELKKECGWGRTLSTKQSGGESVMVVCKSSPRARGPKDQKSTTKKKSTRGKVVKPGASWARL